MGFHIANFSLYFGGLAYHLTPSAVLYIGPARHTPVVVVITLVPFVMIHGVNPVGATAVGVFEIVYDSASWQVGQPRQRSEQVQS
jgi:hypothetical protein